MGAAGRVPPVQTPEPAPLSGLDGYRRLQLLPHRRQNSVEVWRLEPLQPISEGQMNIQTGANVRFFKPFSDMECCSV